MRVSLHLYPLIFCFCFSLEDDWVYLGKRISGTKAARHITGTYQWYLLPGSKSMGGPVIANELAAQEGMGRSS